MAGDIVWTADINASPFVQSTNRMRAEAKRTRDEVQKSFQDMFFANSNQVAQRESAQRARAAEIAAPSNNFFAASASMATQDAIEKEQRLAMAQRVRFEAEAHHEQQRIAMRARMDAAYEQQIADERRLAQQKAVQAAADGRMDRVVKLAMEQTYRQKAINLVLAEEAAEKKLAATRKMTSAALGVSGAGANRANRFGLITQQLSYGLEDAATQFGTMGFAGAVRGATNNLTAAAAVMGPTIGTLVSLGAAAGLVGLTMSNLADDEKKAAEAAERFAESQRDALAAIRHRAEFEAKLRDERSVSAVENERKSAQQSIEGIKAAESEAQRQFDAQKKLVDQKQKNLQDAYDKLNYVGAWGAGPTEQDVKHLAELGRNLENLASERRRLEKENEERQKQMPEVKNRQAEDEATKKKQQDLEDAKREADRYYEESLNAAEKYQRDYDKIWKLRKEHPELISEITAMRAAEKARMEMQKEMDKGIHVNVDVTTGKFVDARSKEALENYYKHLMTARRDMPMPNSAPPPLPPQPSDWERSQQDAQRKQEEMQAAAEEAKRIKRERDLVEEELDYSGGTYGWGHRAAAPDMPTYEDPILGYQQAQGPAPSRFMKAQEDAAKAYGPHSWMRQDPNTEIDGRDTQKGLASEYNKQAQLQQKLVSLTERLVKLQEQSGTKPAQQPEEQTANF